MKRKTLALVLASVMTVSLAACGGSGSDSAAASSAAPAAESAASASEAAPEAEEAPAEEAAAEEEAAPAREATSCMRPLRSARNSARSSPPRHTTWKSLT